MDLIRIHIDELVLDGVPAEGADLANTINTHLRVAFVERGLTAQTAAQVALAVGSRVARDVNA
ncbi:MAG TPA: hypothetical protein VGL99_01180 [Chloroflexota bacterium]|jgi:hypothetical protein